ncbi:AmmeMemoRadiSam system protein A [Paratrimastix pyriformis]|uniref:AmmeMemoRadiSam system protein A n=1 Tax=Paratrimastix pyriformis TaxID=342808 RepID=A0ABQ8UG85_9EUKA|nr:AmmeMemoRadiSam system protein A [Paratrimastix pyriformis]|eukprot:GAFH01005220.1.p1 GENE.GAFH01005220.1~~GAFH01005220.1.p1  ORF type:complete len:198 (-),score=12.69 GAFH01005220.1:38-631(-)
MANPATPEMCAFCFDTLLAHFNPSAAPPTPTFTNDAFPIFVTWTKGPSSQLRGCIGNFEPRPLHRQLAEYALVSSLRDTRFRPISPSEVPQLQVGVSLLHTFEPGHKWDDWEIGKHGILLTMEMDGEQYRATYLPEVASEQEWDIPEAITSLLRKAGYPGVLNERTKAAIQIERYQSGKAHMSHAEYLAWKQQHPAH